MKQSSNGFSLVEVVIALGVISFALLTMLALLPIGLKINHTSSEETRATFILTTLEADLRNTYPGINGGNSQVFNLPLPYALTGGQVTLNAALPVGAFYSAGLDGNEVLTGAGGVPLYQVSVTYTRTPAVYNALAAAEILTPIQAHLVVNWPYVKAPANSTVLTSGAVSGFVESYISFPAP